MKKVIYALIVTLVVASGLVLANRYIKNEKSKTSSPKPLTAAEREAEMKQWEATPAGIAYNKWKASPQGQKVLTDAATIVPHTTDSSTMEAVVTSLSLPPNSLLGFGVMVSISGKDYILSFGLENFNNEFERLHSLKVNDKIMIKSNSVSHAPKYSYAIISCYYVERNNTIMYKRNPRKDGC